MKSRLQEKRWRARVGLLGGMFLLGALSFGADHPLFDAIKRGDVAEMNRLIDEDPSCVNVKEEETLSRLNGVMSVFVWAIYYGDVETVRVLVERGANITPRGADLCERLRSSLATQIEMRNEALEKRRRFGEEALIYPEKQKLKKDFQESIERQARNLAYLEPIYREYFRKAERSPVWKMLERRDAAALEKWLEDGGDRNLARSRGRTLLEAAYRNLDAASARVLLERGAPMGANLSPWQVEKMALALRAPILHHRLSDPRNRSQINVRGKDGESPFTRAVLRGLTTEELQVWLEKGGGPKARGAQGRAIEECVGAKKREKQRMRAQRDCKEYLERRMSGEDVRPEWKDEGRAYRIPDKRRKGIPTDPAVSELKKRWKLRYDAKPMSYRELCDERRKIWEEFLRRHPEFRLDSRGEDGETLLNAAIRAYDYRATELLLSLGADPRVTDADGSCPAEAMIECARLYDEARRIDGSASQITLLCAIFSIASRMTEEEIERDLKPLRPLLESEAKRRELLLGLLAKTTSLNAIRELLNGGYLSPDYKDAQGRTLDRIIASDLQEEDYILSAMKRILENCR